MELFGREIVHCDGILEQRIVARDHGDSAVGDVILGAVSLGVVANDGPFGNIDVTVNDGFADASAPSDVNVGEKNTAVNFRVGIHAHIRRQHASAHGTTGDDAAHGNDGVSRLSSTPGIV